MTLQQEQRDIAQKVDNLTRLINSPKWDEIGRAERSRLIRQLAATEQLDHVLLERIAAAERES